jgi:PAS domain S-box-containing protein
MSSQRKLNKDNKRHPGIDDLPLTIVLDGEGVILQWSSKARAMFGWNNREVIGLPFHKTILPEKHHIDFLKLLASYERSSTEHLLHRAIEISACGKDHAEFDISMGISPVIISGERFCICYISDITERKMVASKMTLVKQLSEQNTQLIDFCNIVSHNLRAPLVNMSMLVDFIERSGDPGEQKMLISKLRPVLENLHATFNELVESIQIKQNLEIEVEDIQIQECMRRTLDGLQAEIVKLRAHIKADFSEAPVLRYPPKYLYSILHNLVSNSLKYHSPKRQPVITVKTVKVDGRIVLSVSDNGLGIDLNKHRHNFFKIGKVFHRHPHAKGFGLFMTKTQIEAMGGRIWVESVPDEGTSFFVEFKN